LLPDDVVVEPKPPSWPPDDDDFKAKLTSKALDDPHPGAYSTEEAS